MSEHLISSTLMTLMKNLAEADMKKIYIRLNHNMLTLNIMKTKYLPISPTSANLPNNLILILYTPPRANLISVHDLFVIIILVGQIIYLV